MTGPLWGKGASATEAVAEARDLEDEAFAWVQRLTSGLADAEDRAAFVLWRDESPAHAAALVRARTLWTDLGPALVADQERQVADQFTQDLGPMGRRAGRRTFMRRIAPGRGAVMRWTAIAASALIAVGVGNVLTQSPFADLKTTSLPTETRLADGSRVTLAPATAMNIDIGPAGERRIDLQKGEAMFDVAHDASRPFVIRSGDGEIRVLGTAFSVKRTGGMTQVIVTRGKVRVSSGSQSRVLEPDRMVVYGLTTMGGMRAVDAAAATAWTEDRLVFENATVGDVIAELDRFDTRKVVLLNGQASQKRVNAVINLKHTDLWLQALQGSEGVTVTHLPGIVLIR